MADDHPGSTITETTVPSVGAGFYYLFRGQLSCNDNASYRTYSAKENAADPGKRDAEFLVCPP